MESNKTRTDLLNFLIEKNGLKRYLEIGLQNAAQNFDKIKCQYKVSVDPDPKAKALFCMTSDDFFDNEIEWVDVTTKDSAPGTQFISTREFDLIFIDGLHTAEQVRKDFENALKVLSPNGFIVLHDCNPLKEEHTIVPRPTERGHWNGDVYKFGVMLSANDCFFTVDIDNGCGVYYGSIPPLYKGQMGAFAWKEFHENRKKLLNLISWDEFVSAHSHV